MDEAIMEKVGPALGKIPSGLFILTGRISGVPIGMLASFIEQASFSPPMISVAMGRDRPMREVLDGSGVFGLHVLGKNNGPLVKTFSRPGAGDPFEGHALLDNVHAIPRLADAWAFLVCTVRNSMAAGDHILYLAEVMDGSLHDSKDEPMVRVRQNGFGY